jgi:hypothetical protein
MNKLLARVKIAFDALFNSNRMMVIYVSEDELTGLLSGSSDSFDMSITYFGLTEEMTRLIIAHLGDNINKDEEWELLHAKYEQYKIDNDLDKFVKPIKK